MKIGLFDSGIGGLTILRSVVRELPEYDYLFYGDTANLPLGDKTEADLYELTIKGMQYLFEQGCLLVIIACNTASAETAKKLQEEYLPSKYQNRKILGVIVPTVEMLEYSGAKSVLLLATTRTVDSAKYLKELKKRGNQDIDLLQVATPELVPLIENGELDKAAESAIEIIEAQKGDRRVVVLGCTHYTEIKNHIRNHFKEELNIISQDEVIPEKLKIYLNN